PSRPPRPRPPPSRRPRRPRPGKRPRRRPRRRRRPRSRPRRARRGRPDAGGRPESRRPEPGMARPSNPVPSRDAILDFVRAATTLVGRREIAKAFEVRGPERAELRRLLKEMADEGLLDFGRRRNVAPPGALPEVTVVEVTGTDEDGEA